MCLLALLFTHSRILPAYHLLVGHVFIMYHHSAAVGAHKQRVGRTASSCTQCALLFGMPCEVALQAVCCTYGQGCNLRLQPVVTQTGNPAYEAMSHCHIS